MTQAQKSKERVRRKRGIFLAMYVVVLLIALGPAAWNWWELQNHPSENTQRKFNASLEFAKTIATIGGGMVLYLNFTVATEGFELAQEKLDRETEKAKTDADLAESRLITDRFSKAIEQLGSEKLAVRLGAIYALERIAHDSHRDHWTIMEVLTSFILEKSHRKPVTEEKIRSKAYELWQENSKHTDKENWDNAIRVLEAQVVTQDIQAALTVIGRRDKRQDPPDNRLDLSGAFLGGANLSEANLMKANLIYVNLGGANLSKANLGEANLGFADLSETNLGEATLNDANLYQADLYNADLSRAHLNRAQLIEAELIRTNLRDANLSDADLCFANLSYAILSHTNFSRANLSHTNFSHTNFSDANLSGSNFLGANLNNAHFSNANLSDADLRIARNLVTTQR